MAKDAQLNIALEEEQKQKWKDHASEYDEYRDLTNLIEQSVEGRIRTDRGDEYSVEQDIELVLNEINDMNSKLDTIEDLSEKLDDTKSSKMDIEQAVERLETFLKTRVVEDDE